MDSTVRVGDRQRAVGGEVELPTAFVGGVVVSAAEWDQVVDVGEAGVAPPADVVWLTMSR